MVGRVGVLVTPDILLYGLGGLALGHFVYPDGVGEDTAGGKNGKWVAGYTAGAGGEVKLNDNWSLRAEYRYLHFGFGRDEGIRSNPAPRFPQGARPSARKLATPRGGSTPISTSARSAWSTSSAPGGNPLSAMAAVPASLETADSWAGFYFGAYFGAGIGRAKESATESSASDKPHSFAGVRIEDHVLVQRFRRSARVT